MAFRFRLHRRVHHVDSVVRRRRNLLAQHVRLAERHLRQVESSVMLRVQMVIQMVVVAVVVKAKRRCRRCLNRVVVVVGVLLLVTTQVMVKMAVESAGC